MIGTHNLANLFPRNRSRTPPNAGALPALDFTKGGPFPDEAVLEQMREDRNYPYHYVLLFRFVLYHFGAAAFVFAAYQQGWIERVIDVDSTLHLCALVTAVFLYGVYLAGRQTWMVCLELNSCVRAIPSPSSRVARLYEDAAGKDMLSRLALLSDYEDTLILRIEHVKFIGTVCLKVGLMGTTIGFIISLSGVNVADVADASAIGPMVGTLLYGMGIALYKTFLGSLYNIWLSLLHRMLKRALGHVKSHTLRAVLAKEAM